MLFLWWLCHHLSSLDMMPLVIIAQRCDILGDVAGQRHVVGNRGTTGANALQPQVQRGTEVRILWDLISLQAD